MRSPLWNKTQTALLNELLLGLWLGESEGATFWIGCLTDLKNRGLRDVFVACIDGLTGFAEAIHAAYPPSRSHV